ncbi:hypothetical protein MD484_g5762, partial [Candolleomyces efflorescens]
MDRIKAKLEALRIEADNNAERADAAEVKVKALEQAVLSKDQEIASLTHKLAMADEDNDKKDGQLNELKRGNLDGESSRQSADNLTRKVQILEDELDQSEKNLKEAVEKLRQVDVKAEHFERQVQRAEQERDAWEKKYEEALAKYKKVQDDLAALETSMQDI